MNRRYIHYEAAFEDYLRVHDVPYVPVDEHRRAIFAGTRVKSFDFLVYHPGGTNWLVDVKGRQFPYDHGRNKRYWENWITRDDVSGLASWQEAFGAGFEAVLVFTYLLGGDSADLPGMERHRYRQADYAFWCARLADYRTALRRRSPKWNTVALSAAAFRRLARPIQEFDPQCVYAGPVEDIIACRSELPC